MRVTILAKRMAFSLVCASGILLPICAATEPSPSRHPSEMVGAYSQITSVKDDSFFLWHIVGAGSFDSFQLFADGRATTDVMLLFRSEEFGTATEFESLTSSWHFEDDILVLTVEDGRFEERFRVSYRRNRICLVAIEPEHELNERFLEFARTQPAHQKPRWKR